MNRPNVFALIANELLHILFSCIARAGEQNTYLPVSPPGFLLEMFSFLELKVTTTKDSLVG